MPIAPVRRISSALSTPPASARSPRARWLGWWLAVLALAALNLQGLQHYQPLMLAGDVCSFNADGSATSVPQGQLDHPRANCELCCAQALASVLPSADPALLALPAAARFVATIAFAAPPAATIWSQSRPRGPPARS
jgi:hypothetical protein